MLIRRVPGALSPRCLTFAPNGATVAKLVASTGFGLGANDPFHIAVTFRDPTANVRLIASLGRNANNRNSSRSVGTSNGRGLLQIIDDGYVETDVTGSQYFTSRWVTAIAEFTSASSRRVITNGSDIVTNSTAITLTNAPSAFVVGCAPDGAYFLTDVKVGHVAVFAGLASAEFVERHRQGLHPTQLPGTLLECWDLDRVGPLLGHRGTMLIPSTLTIEPGGLGPNWAQGPPTVRRVFFGVAGGTYQESIGLSAALALAPSAQLTMQGAVAMTAGAAVADTAIGTLQAAATLAAIAAQAPSSTLTAQETVSLSAATGLTPSVIATLAAQLALTADASLTPAATLIAQASALLSAQPALSASAGAETYSESMALAAQAALVTTSLSSMLASVGLDATTALQPTHTLTAGAAVAFGMQAAIATAAAQMHTTAVALQAATGIAAAPRADYQASIALAVAAVLQAAGSLVGAPTYAVLRVTAETLRASTATTETLRAAAATGDTLTVAQATDEELLS